MKDNEFINTMIQPQDFVHLHVHTEFSLMDGAISIPKLVQKIKTSGQTAVAITDHANMFGAIDFYTHCKNNQIKPIIGLEVYHESLISDSNKNPFHLVLLAKNKNGYQNLLKLASLGYLNPSFETTQLPVLTASQLLAHLKDLFVLTSCHKGEFFHLAQNNPEELINFVNALKSYADSNSIFVELIQNKLPQNQENLKLLAIKAQELGLPIVASSDAHYLNPEDKEAHCILLGIKNELSEKQMHKRLQNYEFHIQEYPELQSYFADYPDAIANTKMIADQCNLELEFGKYVLPPYKFESGETAEAGLKRLSYEGLAKRIEYLKPLYGSKLDEAQIQSYYQRLDYELDIINKMGFAGYFLIVQDFINWAKNHDIPVGPGRGSGAGSLVAYALRITDLDPIPYNLIFERFLNPERISMPDFDVDFCQSRRDEVIQYVTQKYGRECVAQITTFGKMLAKAVIRDVGRVLGLGYKRVDQIAKLIPNDLGMTLTKAFEMEPRILEEASRNSEIKKMIDIALQLEGLTRHSSVHAAGVIISDGPMIQHCPIYTAQGTEGFITQYEMTKAEKVGLIKFDFLGLKTLTVIAKAVEFVRQRKNPDFNIDSIPLNHKQVYDQISSAHTVGIFQLESTGMQQLLRKLQPNAFEDIIATVALFRPGPLGSGMVDDFIERKHGRQKLDYMLPELTPILKDTYGIILYQEQVQKAAATLANYSLGEADLLRKAMGKKKPDEMARQKVRFIEGCQNNKIPAQKAEEIFDIMAKFAEYGFNKSHSAAYGLISYQTAYLKCLYPEEFMAAIMTCDMDNTDKIVRYTLELQRLGIHLCPPCINKSEVEFRTYKNKEIIFGLGALKGLGTNMVEQLLEERKQNGSFDDLLSLAKRINLQKLGRKNFELLILAGALDCFKVRRAELLRFLPELMSFSESYHQASNSGQGALFDETPAEDQSCAGILVPKPLENPEYSLFELIEEKKILGTPISMHPTELFAADVRAFSHTCLANCKDHIGEEINIVCLLEDISEQRTKSSGKRIQYVLLSDHSATVEGLIYEDDIAEINPELNSLVVVRISPKRRFDSQEINYNIKKITPLSEFRTQQLKKLRLKVKDINAIDKVKSTIQKFPGEIPVEFDIYLENKTLVKIRDTAKGVSACNEVIESLIGLRSQVDLQFLV